MGQRQLVETRDTVGAVADLIVGDNEDDVGHGQIFPKQRYSASALSLS
jgi:hypothetical protein